MKITGLLCLVILSVLGGCSSDEEATETNFTELPCGANNECPENGSCVFTREADANTNNAEFCNIQPSASAGSTIAAARCSRDANCGEGSRCLFFADDGADAVEGFCSIPLYCPRYCMTAADAVGEQCSSNSDCAADSFCVQVSCAQTR